MKKLIIILLIITFISCDKKESKNIITNDYLTITKCSPLVGIWFCLNVDTIIKDSIVIEVDYYGFRNNESYVQYKCNIQEFDTLLWHYCPYKAMDDDIHFTYNNRDLTFRYYH